MLAKTQKFSVVCVYISILLSVLFISSFVVRPISFCVESKSSVFHLFYVFVGGVCVGGGEGGGGVVGGRGGGGGRVCLFFGCLFICVIVYLFV